MKLNDYKVTFIVTSKCNLTFECQQIYSDFKILSREDAIRNIMCWKYFHNDTYAIPYESLSSIQILSIAEV